MQAIMDVQSLMTDLPAPNKPADTAAVPAATLVKADNDADSSHDSEPSLAGTYSNGDASVQQQADSADKELADAAIARVLASR